MTSVRSMASLTSGLGGRNSISTNTEWSEDDKRRSNRLHHSYLEKLHKDQKELSKSEKAILEEEIRYIDYRLITEQPMDPSDQSTPSLATQNLQKISVSFPHGDKHLSIDVPIDIEKDTYPIRLSFTHCETSPSKDPTHYPCDIAEHPSVKRKFFNNEDGKSSIANIKQALGRPHKVSKLPQTRCQVDQFTSAQDGRTLQDEG
ncbi:hypothetical protein Tco_0596499 [Tanacetum coccineum]